MVKRWSYGFLSFKPHCMLSCYHAPIIHWSALSLVCLFVCPCFPVPSCGCYRCCLRISLLALQLLMRSSEPRTGTPSPGAGLTPTGEDSALKPQCTLPDTCWDHNAQCTPQCTMHTTMHSVPREILIIPLHPKSSQLLKPRLTRCSIAWHPKSRINLLISSDNSLQGKAFKQMFNQSFQSRKFRKNERKHLLIHD